MNRKVGIIGLALLLMIFGEGLPRLLIDDGVKKFSGEKQTFAAAAWTEARFFFSGSAEPIFWTAIQVHNVEEKTDPKGQKCYRASVRAYTIFGLPWSSVLVNSCDGGSAVRQKWGLAPLILGIP